MLSRTRVTIIKESSGVGFASGHGLEAPKCAGAVMERHFKPKEVAAILGLSDDMVRRLFAKEPVLVANRCATITKEPGVLDFSFADERSKSTGRNRLLRIPESVLQRVCQKRRGR